MIFARGTGVMCASRSSVSGCASASARPAAWICSSVNASARDQSCLARFRHPCRYDSTAWPSQGVGNANQACLHHAGNHETFFRGRASVRRHLRHCPCPGVSGYGTMAVGAWREKKARLNADEHRCAQMNTDSAGSGRSRRVLHWSWMSWSLSMRGRPKLINRQSCFPVAAGG